MKKRFYISIAVIIALLFITGSIYVRNKNIHQGSYYNEQGIKLGLCTSTRKTTGGGWTTYINYYNHSTLLGTCSAYIGPGSSGGNKTELQCNQFLVDSGLTMKKPGNGGVILTVPTYECILK